MTFTDTISNILGVELGPIGEFIVGFIGAVFWATIILTLVALSMSWFKRKWNARLGDRVAVNRVGPFGILILVADGLKMLSKEVVIPKNADKVSYLLAPVISLVAILTCFAFIPWGLGLQLADPETGLVFAFALSSVPAIATVMAGYSSNNKYSFMGFEREVAQAIAYEIPLVVSAACILPLVSFFLADANPLQFSHIVEAQQGSFLGFLPRWFIFVHPVAGVLFFIALLAEFARNPFDLPEAGSELVAGYQTEYGSAYFALIFISEFAHMFFGGALFTALFLGGGTGPILPSPIWFLIKTFLFFVVVQWLRATLPRVRIDQLLEIGWKRLLEFSFAVLIATTGILWIIT